MTEAGMLNLTIRDNLASPPRRIVRRPTFCLRSSVVEQRLDKALAASSILAGGTNYKEKTKWGDRSFTHACSIDLLY